MSASSPSASQPESTSRPTQMTHLILHVADTEATLDFWCAGLGAALESDEEMEAPALDAIFGRKGVRIRDTFFKIAGVRIHTIETLDVKRTRRALAPFERPVGLSGLSFRVPEFDQAHLKAQTEGRAPTEIYTFDDLETPVRMFFLEDPDGLRVEMIEEG